MSRTTRAIPNWCSIWYKEEIDLTCRWRNGYDRKPSSALYYDYIKQPGWNVDPNNSPKNRRSCKKSARRHRRREGQKLINDWMMHVEPSSM